VIRVETASEKQVTITCTTEIMRPEEFTLPLGDNRLADSFRGVVNGPVRPSESADVVMSKQGRIQWYHRNETSLYDTIFKYHGIPELTAKYPDPYMHRTFGAVIEGTGMDKKDDTSLQSSKHSGRL